MYQKVEWQESMTFKPGERFSCEFESSLSLCSLRRSCRLLGHKLKCTYYNYSTLWQDRQIKLRSILLLEKSTLIYILSQKEHMSGVRGRVIILRPANQSSDTCMPHHILPFVPNVFYRDGGGSFFAHTFIISYQRGIVLYRDVSYGLRKGQ